MKGDFSRMTFERTKHFSRVLKQQGRVTLDADDNEQTDIVLHYLRTLAQDLIGHYAVPAGAGFDLTVATDGLHIGRGRCYVDGILVENDVDDWLYSAQKDYPLPDDDPLSHELQNHKGQAFWIYLDVWERYITALDDDDIRDKALGGPDTCGRAKVVWQVKGLPVEQMPENDDDEACPDPLDELVGISDATLAARVDPGKRADDPCVTPPDSRYRGAENRLYRVEIHQGGKVEAATFKWSRDNGSDTAAWLETRGNDLVVSRTRGFTAGNWVELSDDTLELQGKPGMLVKLIKVEGDVLSVDPAAVATAGIGWSASLVNPKVRRWDQVQTEDVVLKEGAVPVEETPANAAASDIVWIDLEDGIQIQFSADGEYRTGDYWLIPARVATGKIEWPPATVGTGKTTETAVPPRGVRHHYAPLGYIMWEGESVTLQVCRCEFSPSRICSRSSRSVKLDMKGTVKAPKSRPKSASAAGRRHKG